MSEPKPTEGAAGPAKRQEKQSDKRQLSALNEPEHEEQNPGPNLKLLYSLLAFALAAAIGLAMLIVLPFYRRR